jgi:hypothetical protein
MVVFGVSMVSEVASTMASDNRLTCCWQLEWDTNLCWNGVALGVYERAIVISRYPIARISNMEYAVTKCRY